MGDNYYKTIKSKKLIALLVRNGFVSKLGSKHGKYENESKIVIVIPRHRVLSPGVSKEICEVLEKQVKVPKEELKKLF